MGVFVGRGTNEATGWVAAPNPDDATVTGAGIRTLITKNLSTLRPPAHDLPCWRRSVSSLGSASAQAAKPTASPRATPNIISTPRAIRTPVARPGAGAVAGPPR